MKNVIYKISTTVSDKVYIGSAVRFNTRKNQHLFHLKNGSHHSKKLQNHINKHGIDVISFSIIESDCINLIDREQFYIDMLNPWFNISKTAGSNKGYRHTKESIIKMVAGRMAKSGYKTGWKHSKETRLKISNNRTPPILTKEALVKMRISSTGKKMSTESKEKISKKLKGRTVSDDTKKKLSMQKIGSKNPMYGKKSPRFGKKYNDVKRKMPRLIINTKTGIVCYGVKEASLMYNIPMSTLCGYLSGFRKNKTDLIYI